MPIRKSLALLLASAVLSSPAHAGWPYRVARQSCPNGTCPTATYGQAAPVVRVDGTGGPLSYPVQHQAAPAADASGFVPWLNGVRAQRGLRPVAWDANLAAWAVANSQSGTYHGVMVGRRQNWGWGSLGAVRSMWLASPAHAAALLDPTITRVGLGAWGSVWTFNGD